MVPEPNTFINEKETTEDSLFDGELVCHQHRDGYRFSIDAVLLAHFCPELKKATVLDLGCGCGIVGLILLYRQQHGIAALHALELQESLAGLARKNCVANDFTEKMKVIASDLKKIGEFVVSETYSHVICNPPFYRVGSGRGSTDNETYLARHQAAATLEDVIRSACFVLKNKGTFLTVVPAESCAELFSLCTRNNLQPKRMRAVYSYPEADCATLVLAECVKNAGVGVKMQKPLYIYTGRNGIYTEDILAMYRPNAVS